MQATYLHARDAEGYQTASAEAPVQSIRSMSIGVNCKAPFVPADPTKQIPRQDSQAPSPDSSRTRVRTDT